MSPGVFVITPFPPESQGLAQNLLTIHMLQCACHFGRLAKRFLTPPSGPMPAMNLNPKIRSLKPAVPQSRAQVLVPITQVPVPTVKETLKLSAHHHFANVTTSSRASTSTLPPRNFISSLERRLTPLQLTAPSSALRRSTRCFKCSTPHRPPLNHHSPNTQLPLEFSAFDSGPIVTTHSRVTSYKNPPRKTHFAV